MTLAMLPLHEIECIAGWASDCPWVCDEQAEIIAYNFHENTAVAVDKITSVDRDDRPECEGVWSSR